jgi:phosphoribosylamine--glycine ligase / phosphoribosylglycinamide formyltransferase / phosphoribosylformylglycinamidine cyclo-ligase
LISGNGSNLQALIDGTRDASQSICADVVLVISNRSKAYGIQRAESAGIPFKVVLKSHYEDASGFETEIDRLLDEAKIDIVCLAGFMRVLSPKFVSKWRGHLLNIHPSLLPKYPGLNVQQQCLDAKDTESGCTVHFVDVSIFSLCIFIVLI